MMWCNFPAILMVLCAASLPGATCFVGGGCSGLMPQSSIYSSATRRGCILGPALGEILSTFDSEKLASSVVLQALAQADEQDEEGDEKVCDGEADEGGEGGGEAWAGEEPEGPLNRKERRRMNRKLRGRDRNRLQGQGDTSISRNKALSQNLLVDPVTIDRMVGALGDTSPNGRCVVELGPGLGALTLPLMEDYPGMTAVELDKNACEELRKSMPSLTLVEGSLLDFDFEAHSKGGRLSVISNLPFGITSSALFRILDYSHVIKRAVLLIQQEAADRILADMSKRKYGTQSIEFTLRSTRVQQVAPVPSIAFDPPPKSTKCAIVSIDFQDELPLSPFEMQILRQAMQAGFDDKGLVLAATLPKRAGLRKLVPDIRDYCEGGANWLQKKPMDLAPGKWVHAARSLAQFAGGGQPMEEVMDD